MHDDEATEHPDGAVHGEPASHRASPNEPRDAGHAAGAGKTPDPDANKTPEAADEDADKES